MEDMIPILVAAASHSEVFDDFEELARDMNLRVAATEVLSPDEALECADQASKGGAAFVVGFLIQSDYAIYDVAPVMLGLMASDCDIRIVVVTREMRHWSAIMRDIPHPERVIVASEPFDAYMAVQFAHGMASSWKLAVGSRTPTSEVEAPSSRELLQTKRVESLQRHAGQLQAMGHLAAGIAHELGTPIQYAMDSSYFLNTLWDDCLKLILSYRAMLQDLVAEHPVLERRLREIETGVDIEFYREEVPSALERLSEGLERVLDILNAMRDLAPRPDDEALELSDFNRMINNTLTVARGTVKRQATIVVEVEELPLVRCRVDKISNVLLNLLVNAAHALEDKFAEHPDLGRVTVKAWADVDRIYVEVGDNGPGIAPEHAEKIFDPFYTTKEVGRGTGQGLAIARAVIESHGGRISFQSRVGQGTKFGFFVPIDGPTALRVAS